MRHRRRKFGGKTGFTMRFQVSAAVLLVLMASVRASGQVDRYPYVETFETAAIPGLPAGWESSSLRKPATNDFTTASGTAHSGTVAVLVTNATLGQKLCSPRFNFAGVVPTELTFFTRRSASFRAAVVVEASEDGGVTFPFVIGDTLLPGGSTAYVHSGLRLPERLADSQEVRFRWRIVPDVSGTTGTFRLDDVAVSVRPSCDLALSGIRITPVAPVDGDDGVAVVTVVNAGNDFGDSAEVRLFRDADGDAVAEPGEGICTKALVLAMREGDSISIPLSLGRLRPGSGDVIAMIVGHGDDNPGNDILAVPLVVGFSRGSLIVNEIMYAPAAPEPEWIELFNPGTDSVDVNGWTISDAAVSVRHAVARKRLKISPAGYMVLTKDSLAFVQVHQGAGKSVVTVIGFPSLNNGGDQVVLFDATGRTIDSVAYFPDWGGNSGGVSLERRDPFDPANDGSSWGSSRSDDRSTPGCRNSIYRKDYDLGIDGCRVLPDHAKAGETVRIDAVVHNHGRDPTARGFVTVCERTIGSEGDGFVRLGSREMRNALEPGDSTVVSLRIPLKWAGVHRFTVILAHPLDQERMNDTGTCDGIADPPPGLMKVNEVMSSPPAGMPEWVEVANDGPCSVDLTGWRIGNRSVQSRYPVTVTPAILRPGELAVITKDSAALAGFYRVPGLVMRVPGLPVSLWNNAADAVVLTAPDGSISDSSCYRSTWGGVGGHSLERRDLSASSVDSSTWAESSDPAGATPGRRNATALRATDLLAAGLRWESVAKGEALLFSLTVVNDGRLAEGPFVVRWYEDVDRDSAISEKERIGTAGVSDSLPPHEICTVIFRWEPARGGSHRIVAVVDAPGDERRENDTARVVAQSRSRFHALVVNEVMFDPGPESCEYLELYNPLQESVDCTGWTVMDRQAADGTSRRGVVLGEGAVKPGEYLVIAADSSVLRRFSPLRDSSPGLLRVGGWSEVSLNNDADDIIVCDATGTTVDSLSYRSAWHAGRLSDVTGISLEKRQPALGSCDGNNWTSSLDPRGGTPGAKNSVWAPLTTGGGALSCMPNPFSPDGDGVEDCCVVHYEVPLRATRLNIRIFDVRGRLVRQLVPQVLTLPGGDLLWDGTDDASRRVRIGIYVLLLEGYDAAGEVVHVMREAVVLAGRLE